MTSEQEHEFQTTWTHDGRECEAIYEGHWCGYVKTDLKFSHMDVSAGNPPIIDAHGGVTYGVDDEGWLGFDTMHAGDVNIGPDEQGLGDGALGENQTLWDLDAVKDECERLAVQIDHLEEFVGRVEYR